MAVMLFGPSMVTCVGFAVPVASPLHPVKLQPGAGVAVMFTTVYSLIQLLPEGSVEPLPEGEIPNVS